MANELKTKRDALIQDAIAKEPCINSAKKLILKICVIFLSARLIFSIVETVYVLNRGLPISSCVINYVMLGVGALFALGIYKQGIKALTYLAIAGGALTILNLQKTDFIANFQMGDSFYNLYVITLIVAMIIQILSMLLILLNGNCKKYFSEITRINKTVTGQGNGGALK